MNEEKNNIAEERKTEKDKAGGVEEKREKESGRAKKSVHYAKKHFPKTGERVNYDFGRLLIGLLVIFAGSLLLAKSAGILPKTFSLEIFLLWPLFIVAFGLSLLDARSRLGSVIGFITLLLVVLILAIFLRDSARKTDTNIRVRTVPGGITQDSLSSPQYHIYSDWSEAK